MTKRMRINKFLVEDFGIGGVNNYTSEQAQKALQIMQLLFSGEFAVVELASIRDFLVGLDLDNTSMNLIGCMDEIEKYYS